VGRGRDSRLTTRTTKHIAQIAAVRRENPSLRYGRFYFRPVSGDGQHFGVSTFPNGVLAFSRILMDQEIVIVAQRKCCKRLRG